MVQLDHLKTHQAIATRLRRGDLRLHGWVYSTGPGDVQVYGWEKRDLVDPGEKQ